jgi:hypothetical protein
MEYALFIVLNNDLWPRLLNSLQDISNIYCTSCKMCLVVKILIHCSYSLITQYSELLLLLVNHSICICYLDVDWLIPNISSYRVKCEVWWRVSGANESQTSYSFEQADIFQYQSYSHSDDMLIILRSNINTNTSIFVFEREKSHDSKYSKYASPKYFS